MTVIATRYKLTCDVNGCDRQTEGTVDQISGSGWTMKLLYGGVPQLESMRTFVESHNVETFPANVICPQCKAQGYYKDMVKK